MEEGILHLGDLVKSKRVKSVKADKPCPFCGLGPLRVKYPDGEFVFCSNGLCRIVDKEFRPEKWNTRPTEDQKDREFMSLAEVFDDYMNKFPDKEGLKRARAFNRSKAGRLLHKVFGKTRTK